MALAFALVAASRADRVITVPMGRKIPFGTFKIDTFLELSRARSFDRWIGVGVSPEIELAYHGERVNGGPVRDTLDVSYNYVTPLTNQSPGISAGIQDVANRTRDGRQVYVAVTWRTAADEIGMGNVPLDVTLGIAQGDRTHPFVGASMPLSESLRLLVESNGNRIASGIDLRLFKSALAGRLVIRDRDVMVGANLTLKF
jgi:hypothetical protein